MNDDEKKIRDLLSTWMSATKAGDTEKVLGLMDDDAKFLVAGRPPFGKEVFAGAVNDQQSSSVEFEGKSEILELKVIGDWAFMLTSLTVVAKQPGSEDMKRSGHTLTILKKKNGNWLLYRDANLLVPVNSND